MAKDNKKELDAKKIEQASGGMYFPDGHKEEYPSVPWDASTESIPQGIVAEGATKLEQLLPKGKKSEHPWYR